MFATEAMAVAAVVVAAEAADDAVAKTTASCRCRSDSCCTRQPSRGSLGRPPTWLETVGTASMPDRARLPAAAYSVARLIAAPEQAEALVPTAVARPRPTCPSRSHH